MRILITGGAGYIGSMLVVRLFAETHHITVLDNFMYRQMPFNHMCTSQRFEVVVGDACDISLLRELVPKADVVIPLAAIVGAPACDHDPDTAWATNVDAIATLVNLLRKDQLLIIPISNSGYGVGERGKECDEDSPLKPVSLYGRSKVEAEKMALHHENAVSLRLATVFGMSPRMRLDLMVNNFVYRAVADRTIVLFEAHFRRNFIHVRDVARAFFFALSNVEKMRGKAFNVGLSNANLTKWELCERIATQVPNFTFYKGTIGKDPDQRDYHVSNARIEKLGFRPIFSLDDGIAELIKGYRMLPRLEYANA